MAAKHCMALPTSLVSTINRNACCLRSVLRLSALQRTASSRYFPSPPTSRLFSSTSRTSNWLAPRRGASCKSRKGRPRVRTGGSVKGTTLVWGDYGIRLKDHDRRISATQLKIADETIKKRLRGMKYRLYTRVSANIGVYTSGNDQRMGKGKGSFDHWATRVPVSKILFELKGEVHEQVVRDAMRLAGNKLPGVYEFVRKGDPPVMGITKVGGAVTELMLRRPRREQEASASGIPVPNITDTAARISASTPA